jgi:hypothetical protein
MFNNVFALDPQVSFINEQSPASANIAPQAIAEAAGQASTGQQHTTVRKIAWPGHASCSSS